MSNHSKVYYYNYKLGELADGLEQAYFLNQELRDGLRRGDVRVACNERTENLLNGNLSDKLLDAMCWIHTAWERVS